MTVRSLTTGWIWTPGRTSIKRPVGALVARRKEALREMRTRTRGIQLTGNGERTVNKQYRGEAALCPPRPSLPRRSRSVAQAAASRSRRPERKNELREGDEQLFRLLAAGKYLLELKAGWATCGPWTPSAPSGTPVAERVGRRSSARPGLQRQASRHSRPTGWRAGTRKARRCAR